MLARGRGLDMQVVRQQGSRPYALLRLAKRLFALLYFTRRTSSTLQNRIQARRLRTRFYNQIRRLQVHKGVFTHRPMHFVWSTELAQTRKPRYCDLPIKLKLRPGFPGVHGQ
jgi:hypothetical protein